MLLSICQFHENRLRKGLIFLWSQVELHRAYCENLWHIPSKERLGKIFVLCHGVHNLVLFINFSLYLSTDSSVGIATRYGLDGPRIETR